MNDYGLLAERWKIWRPTLKPTSNRHLRAITTRSPQRKMERQPRKKKYGIATQAQKVKYNRPKKKALNKVAPKFSGYGSSDQISASVLNRILAKTADKSLPAIEAKGNQTPSKPEVGALIALRTLSQNGGYEEGEAEINKGIETIKKKQKRKRGINSINTDMDIRSIHLGIRTLKTPIQLAPLFHQEQERGVYLALLS